MAEAAFSLLGYVRRQFGDDRQQKFDFTTVAGDKVTGSFAAWPEADDGVVVVLTPNDRLHVIVVSYLVSIAEYRPTDAREALSTITTKVKDAGAARLSGS